MSSFNNNKCAIIQYYIEQHFKQICERRTQKRNREVVTSVTVCFSIQCSPDYFFYDFFYSPACTWWCSHYQSSLINNLQIIGILNLVIDAIIIHFGIFTQSEWERNVIMIAFIIINTTHTACLLMIDDDSRLTKTIHHHHHRETYSHCSNVHTSINTALAFNLYAKFVLTLFLFLLFEHSVWDLLSKRIHTHGTQIHGRYSSGMLQRCFARIWINNMHSICMQCALMIYRFVHILRFRCDNICMQTTKRMRGNRFLLLLFCFDI